MVRRALRRRATTRRRIRSAEHYGAGPRPVRRALRPSGITSNVISGIRSRSRSPGARQRGQLRRVPGERGLRATPPSGGARRSSPAPCRRRERGGRQQLYLFPKRWVFRASPAARPRHKARFLAGSGKGQGISEADGAGSRSSKIPIRCREGAGRSAEEEGEGANYCSICGELFCRATFPMSRICVRFLWAGQTRVCPAHRKRTFSLSIRSLRQDNSRIKFFRCSTRCSSRICDHLPQGSSGPQRGVHAFAIGSTRSRGAISVSPVL